IGDWICPGNLFVFRKVFWLGNRYFTVVPDEFHRPALSRARKFKCNARARRISHALRLHIVVLHFRHDAGRRTEIKGPERGIDYVTDPIADRSAAEMEPTAPVPGNPKRRIWLEFDRPDPHV